MKLRTPSILSLSIILFLSIISNNPISCQNIYTLDNYHINRLHDSSVLLVRLQTKHRVIESYRNSNNEKAAEKTFLKQNKLNQQILDAFDEYFNFCKVYFFFSDQSQNIQNREIDNIVFLDNKLQEDKSIKPELTNFYIAEFGVVSSETGLQGLMIKDDNFKLLEKPFPYYSKNPFFASKSKFAFTTVKRFNNNLHRYYQNTK
jgi:hypothetical protein